MGNSTSVSAAVLLLLFIFCGLNECSAEQLVDLKCDYRVTPLAVDRSDPMLSWRLQGQRIGRKGLAQTAYQIQAATSAQQLDQPDLWDTGWVSGAKSNGIIYAGKLPAAKERVFWRVRIKDEAGKVVTWSKVTWFDRGLLQDGDWQGASWISCDRKLKRDYGPAEVMGDWIAASGKPESGTPEKAKTITYKLTFTLPEKQVVYAGAWWNHVDKGSTELMVNGRKGVSGPEGPATIFYKDYSFYLESENEVSITLTDADSSTPVSFGMQVVFADGSTQLIQTSAQWQVQVEEVQVGQVRVGEEQEQAKVVCPYGARPLGEAMTSPRAPLAAAWYKKDFDVSKQVASARLYVCGLGYNEPYLNGQKVGDEVLAPGQTDYQHFAHYNVFDVRDQIKQGANALSVLLGDGFYNNHSWFSHARYRYGNPGLRTYLDIRYEDGTNQKIVSGNDWRWKESGLTMSNVFLGDYLDYRKWHDQWKQPGEPAGWKPVKTIEALSPKLTAQDFPPIRVVREIEPVKTMQVGEKTWIVDLGQNISGWVGLEFNEPAGTVIRIRCAEMLTEDGQQLDNVPQSFWSCHASPQHHRIIADGKPHKWRPYFSYHGFRYAEIHGLTKAPTAGQIKGMVVNTDAPVIATFESSDPLLDRIFKMGIQTHLNNMHSILEDCPHREKCLWGGDAHSSWATGFYTLDSASFYRQQVRLFLTPPFDPKGIPGRIGVGKRATNKTVDFTWSVSPLFLAWRNYQLNGDIQTAGDYYEVMKKFLRYFEKKSPELIPHIYRYGDHAAPIGIPRTPQDPQLIAALNFYAAADRFADLADALGKVDDAKWSRDLAGRIGESVLKKYYDSELKTFGNGTHDSLALAFGIVDPAEEKAVAASLAKVYQENGKKFDGGFMSYFIYPQLTKYGYVDLALEMLRNPDYPGIAQSIRDYDATTIFERFRNDSRGQQLRQSLDHHAMNHPTAWLLNDIAGIQVHPNHPGGQRLLLAPRIPQDLQKVNASVRLNYGLVESAWEQNDGSIRWSVNVPPNTVAEVRLDNPVELVVDGKVIEDNASELTLKSGQHVLQWSVAAGDVELSNVELSNIKLSNIELIGATTVDENALTFAAGPAAKFSTAVNGRTHQQTPLTTYRGYQYVTHFDAQRRVCIGRRKLTSNSWEVIHFDDHRFKTNDSHNTAVLGICDRDGTIHMAFDHHATELNYRISKLGAAHNPESVQWNADLFGPVTHTLGSVEPNPRVTYPRFFSAPNGNLMLFYRGVTSGNGNGMLEEYDGRKHDWTPGLGKVIARDIGTYTTNGQASDYRCAYMNSLSYAGSRLHASWVWRDRFKKTNPRNQHDLCYAYSDDDGRTWMNSAGEEIGKIGKRYIHLNSPGLVVAPIPVGSGLTNQNTHFAYPDGSIHVVMRQSSTTTAGNRYFHYWRNHKGQWNQEMLPFTGSRPKIIGTKNRALILVYGEENEGSEDDKNELAIAKGEPNSDLTRWKWTRVKLPSRYGVTGEPLVDLERWQQEQVLSIYLQEAPPEIIRTKRTEAVDGVPSPLNVLDFRLIGDNPNNEASLICPPAGRLAIVIDGNSPDPDDIGATAVTLGLLKAAGLTDRLVHLSHSCDLKPVARISVADELRRQKVLHQLCADGITHFGPFANIKDYFNCRTEQESAVGDLRDAINQSSKQDPLWIIEAGEPDIIGFALKAANPSMRQFVHVVSHHPANDDSGDFFKWQEILDFGITEHQIGDQNVGLQTAIDSWDWAKGHQQPGINWIWKQLAYAEQDGVVKFQTNKFDCSDAGMVYWWITGANKNGNKLATPNEIAEMLR